MRKERRRRWLLLLVYLAVIGYLLSLLVYVGGWMGVVHARHSPIWGLRFGVFLVWGVAVVRLLYEIIQDAAKGVPWRGSAKRLIDGCPAWLKVLVLVTAMNAAAIQLGSNGGMHELRVASSQWLLFYALGGAILRRLERD